MHDVVVVGAGAAGGWAAKELCERGLDVLLLDAGPQLDARNFPVPPPDEQRLVARLGALRRQPVQVRCAAFNGRTQRFFVDDRDNPYTTPRGRPFNWFRGRQVGGRLHVWARVVPRLSPLELRDWPIDYDELAPYYDRVESFLGVDDAPSTREEERFRGAVERAFPELTVGAVRVARAEPGPEPSTIRAAAATGRLTIRPNAVVRRVELDARAGKATGVSFVDRVTRAQSTADARAVVLCASTIETLRLMLVSGIGTSSGRLGRGLMDHVLTGLGGPLGEDRVDPVEAVPYDAGFVTGFQIPRFQNLDRRDRGYAGGWGVQGGMGRGNAGWYFLAHGETLARDENRVTLDRSRTDAWGVPVARIDCAPGPNDLAMAADQLETMRELAAEAGLEVRTPPSGRPLDALAFRLWRRRLLARHGAFHPGTAAHELGGAPMGDDPRASVLDRFNRCWDAENVFVTDGASFAAGCWQNVTLTIMAVTARACEHLAVEL